MDPRLDGKWNGSTDPRTALPFDPWTEARCLRRVRKNAIPCSHWQFMPAVILLIGGIIAAVSAGWVWHARVFYVLLPITSVSWFMAWFTSPIRGLRPDPSEARPLV